MNVLRENDYAGRFFCLARLDKCVCGCYNNRDISLLIRQEKVKREGQVRVE